MYNYEEILAQLKDGANADDLADSFVKALNAAQEELRKAAQEEETQAAKIADTSSLLEIITDYLAKYYPSIKFDSANTAEDFIALLDNVAQIQTTFSDFLEKAPKRKACKHCGDPIEEFLTSFGF